MPVIEDRVERKRGCGFRKEGGFYLVANGPAVGCGKLPIPLAVCPCCHAGIKPTRGWTWINGTALAAEKVCDFQPSDTGCEFCPLAKPMGRVGLLWIGEKFYKTPEDFQRESIEQGISRRISQIPRDFKVGETYVWLAHRKTIKNEDGTFTPAVFRIFRPQRIEYVVKKDDSDEKLDKLAERGITLVRVKRASDQEPVETKEPEQQPLF